MSRRLGAYVLPGDPVWLHKTLRQYYPLLDELVVPVPIDGRGWTGVPIPVARSLELIRAADTRGILREVPGTWVDRDEPIRADTAQRQAAVTALNGRVDWVLQLDNDEYLPRPEALTAALDEADSIGVDAVEWPMRVLYRRTRRRVFEVVSPDGRPWYEYPGPIAVRPTARLREARRAEGEFLRVVVIGDRASLQVTRPAEPGERRRELIEPRDAIVHDSWARTPAEIRRKVASWGHAGDAGFGRYYWLRWWPAPLLWRVQRDLHPFSPGVWPALASRPNRGELADG